MDSSKLCVNSESNSRMGKSNSLKNTHNIQVVIITSFMKTTEDSYCNGISYVKPTDCVQGLVGIIKHPQ